LWFQEKEFQNKLLALSKLVANATAALVLQAKGVASQTKDPSQQNQVRPGGVHMRPGGVQLQADGVNVWPGGGQVQAAAAQDLGPTYPPLRSTPSTSLTGRMNSFSFHFYDSRPFDNLVRED
jgi:hypothetical protein